VLVTFGRKEVGIFLDPAKLMYLDEKTPRAEDSWLPLNREPAGRS
jgi:hypothetical protein